MRPATPHTIRPQGGGERPALTWLEQQGTHRHALAGRFARGALQVGWQVGRVVHIHIVRFAIGQHHHHAPPARIQVLVLHAEVQGMAQGGPQSGGTTATQLRHGGQIAVPGFEARHVDAVPALAGEGPQTAAVTEPLQRERRSGSGVLDAREQVTRVPSTARSGGRGVKQQQHGQRQRWPPGTTVDPWVWRASGAMVKRAFDQRNGMQLVAIDGASACETQGATYARQAPRETPLTRGQGTGLP